MDRAEKPAVTEEGRKQMGQHLRTLRKRRGWTQEELREKSGVSVPTIRAIERDYPPGRQRSKSTLMALSRSLGLPDDYLGEYQVNPRPEESPDDDLDDAQPLSIFEERLNSIIEARLSQMILPRLDNIDNRIRTLVDTMSPQKAVEVKTPKHSG